MKKGLFITFEGIDGCGKTTQLNLLNNWLIDNGYRTLTLREPGGTLLGEKIRTILLNPEFDNMTDFTELSLFLAARSQLCRELIQPALNEDKIVLCDRFEDSTVAYQGFGRGMAREVLTTMNKMATNNLEPDITFYFDISLEAAKRRVDKRFENDRIEAEKDEFRQRVIDGYKYLVSTKDRIISIDGNRDIQTIFADIVANFEEKRG